MDIEKIKQEFNMKLSLRDSLPICESEIKELEEDENVQKYLRLKNHEKQFGYLKDKSDDWVLESVIAKDSDSLDDIYFCYGKGFEGFHQLAGGYYIPNQISSIRHLKGIRVAKYRNLSRPEDVVIVPGTDTEAFEQSHKTINCSTPVPEAEYHEIRLNMYKQLLKEDVEKKTYFCLGKYYRGDQLSNGSYVIRNKNMPKPYRVLSYYKNLYNPEDVVIIPTSETAEFERDKIIHYHFTNDPENDYYTVRKEMGLEEKPKVLAKENKHEQ